MELSPMHEWGCAALAVSLGLALVAPAAARADSPTPPTTATAAAPGLVKVGEYHAGGNFIDDPFALSDDGKTLVYITTDGATRSEIHFAAVGNQPAPTGTPSPTPAPAGPGADVALPYRSITPERVTFLDGERVLVVERNPSTHFARAEVYTKKGPAHESFGPATDVGLGDVQGTPAIITWLRAPAARGVTHTFTAYRRDTLKLLARKVLAENEHGKLPLAGSLYKPLYFLGGYGLLVAQKEGEYDKQADVRKPDLEARVDVFSGRLVASREIKDVVAFTVMAQLRARHPNEPFFVRYSEDNAHLELVDADDGTTDLVPAHPLGKYEAQTLESHAVQPADPAALDVSLTVDPVNPEAVRAQKADKDWLDVYRVDAPSKKLALLVRVDGQKRPTAWRLASGRLGVLRKHKGFGRGGADLEVYDVTGLRPPEPVAGRPASSKAAATEKSPAVAGKPAPTTPTGAPTGTGTGKVAAPAATEKLSPSRR